MSSEDIKTEINLVASKINQFILNNISGEPFACIRLLCTILIVGVRG